MPYFSWSLLHLRLDRLHLLHRLHLFPGKRIEQQPNKNGDQDDSKAERWQPNRGQDLVIDELDELLERHRKDGNPRRSADIAFRVHLRRTARNKQSRDRQKQQQANRPFFRHEYGFYLVWLLRYWVVAAGVERMTAANPFGTEPQPF